MTQVYRGKQAYVHIEDGKRAAMGREIAANLDLQIRHAAAQLAKDDVPRLSDAYNLPLCPGCYMVAIFNAAVECARRNGQSLTELGNSLGNAFLRLAQSPNDSSVIESIEVQLDSDPCPIPNQESQS